MLGDGYFYPEIPADSRIGVDTDNNCFSITDIEGNTKSTQLSATLMMSDILYSIA